MACEGGERLSVLFFGASLTWGANASDPQLTSYRGVIAQRLEAAYPMARFKFWDAAIGGTGSQLGVFRFERDVLRRRPDLVFLDFTANDGIADTNSETLASYGSLVRRIIQDAHAPVVQAVFPFLWDVQRGNTDAFTRQAAHYAINDAYDTAIGDAVVLCQRLVKSGDATLQKLWPFDSVHPRDAGYAVFARCGVAGVSGRDQSEDSLRRAAEDFVSRHLHEKRACAHFDSRHAAGRLAR